MPNNTAIVRHTNHGHQELPVVKAVAAEAGACAGGRMGPVPPSLPPPVPGPLPPVPVFGLVQPCRAGHAITEPFGATQGLVGHGVGLVGTPPRAVVGVMVGATVGVELLGGDVGVGVENEVGAEVGRVVGVGVGEPGANEGALVGTAVGCVVVGELVGGEVGCAVGRAVSVVGAAVGTAVGAVVGVLVGADVGALVGDGVIRPTVEQATIPTDWSHNTPVQPVGHATQAPVVRSREPPLQELAIHTTWLELVARV